MLEKESNILTNAQKTYIKCQQTIKNMARADKKESEKKILRGLDLLIQVCLLYTSISDNKITYLETSFIDKLSIECDLLDVYNTSSDKKIVWSDFLDSEISKEDKVGLINLMYEKTYIEIQNFIMYIAMLDSMTKKDYKSIIVDQLKQIVLYLIQIDGSVRETEQVVSQQILDKLFFSRYDSFYEAFSRAAEIKLK